MYQLIINTNTENKSKPELDCWEEVELGTATVALTYQANDLAELKSREVNRSNRIKLPRTAKNDQLFGIPSEPLSATVAPYRYFDCRLYDDGVELFGKGAKLQLMDTTDTTYEVCIKGSLFDFFENIKNLSLRDLDVTAYNAAHSNEQGVLDPAKRIDYTPWTVAAVANTSEDNAVVFPLIDWDTANNASLVFSQPNLPNSEIGEEGNSESLRIHIESQYIFPAVKLSALVDAICLAQGYTLRLPEDVINDPEKKYKQAVVPVCSLHPGKKQLDDIKNEPWIAASQAAGTALPYRVGSNFIFHASLRHNIAPIDGNENNPCYVFRPRYNGTYTFKILAASKPTSNPSPNLHIQYDIYNAKGDKLTPKGVAVDIPLNSTPAFVVEDIEKDGYIRFWIRSNRWPGVDYAELKAFSFTCSEFKPIGAIFPTNEFPVLQNMPDITQLDLFKAVCQLYGLMVSIDESNKHIEAYTFNNVVASIAKEEYVDWSDKLDDTSHSSTYQWSSYGQNNYIAYAEEEGKDGEKLQDRACFTITNHTLPAEKTLFELPFATCEETRVCGHAMAKIRMVEGGDNSPDSITEPKPKLLFVERKGVKVKFINEDNEYDQQDISKVIIATSSQLDTTHFINNYYKILSKRLLPRVRVQKEKIWLTPIDIHKFTHKKPIFISKYNSCFYVNKINNYQSNKLTEVEFVAILP